MDIILILILLLVIYIINTNVIEFYDKQILNININTSSEPNVILQSYSPWRNYYYPWYFYALNTR